MKVLKPPQSGSAAGITAGRNRFGQYERTRAIPVNPSSVAQGLVRARMSANSAAYRTLTPTQRAGWASLGNQMVRSDSLGQSYTLQGNQAYASVNNNLLLMGDVIIADAPALTTPDALTLCTLTVTTTTMSVAYAATPVPADAAIAIFAGPIRSAGRSYEGDFRFVYLEAGEETSPADIFTAYSAKFGTPTAGSRIFVSAVVIAAGFQSGAIISSAIVT